MPIQPGIYVIRRDVIGIDDVFATGVGVEVPMLGLPLQSNPHNVQRWEVRQLDGNSYEIVKPEYMPGPPGGFGVDELYPEAPVKYKTLPSTWVINCLDEERRVYSIQIARAPPGATYAVDLSKKEDVEELILKPFPIIPEPPVLPGWIFMAVEEN